MVKAILTTKSQSIYDDLPEQRYHFPRTYLNAVEAAVGDWIIYYEPRRPTTNLSRRGGRQSYLATARITGIEPDPSHADHFYALIDGYLEFGRPATRRSPAKSRQPTATTGRHRPLPYQRRRPCRSPGRPHPPAGKQRLR